MVKIVTSGDAVQQRQPADPLDNLGAGLELGTQAPEDAAADAEAAAQQRAAEQAEAQMLAGLSKFALAVLKGARARIAKTMPEILEHWSDADLEQPAQAVPPVIKKRLALIGPLVGKYPEESALVMAMMPLLMGYLAAMDAAQKRLEGGAVALSDGDGQG